MVAQHSVKSRTVDPLKTLGAHVSETVVTIALHTVGSQGIPLDKIGFSVPEVAKMMGISRDAAYAYAKTGEIPTVRIGGRMIVPVWFVESFREKEQA